MRQNIVRRGAPPTSRGHAHQTCPKESAAYGAASRLTDVGPGSILHKSPSEVEKLAKFCVD
jgi:hypothetical protein